MLGTIKFHWRKAQTLSGNTCSSDSRLKPLISSKKGKPGNNRWEADPVNRMAYDSLTHRHHQVVTAMMV